MSDNKACILINNAMYRPTGHPTPQGAPGRTKFLLIAGFSASLLVSVFIAGIGLSSMNALLSRMNSIVKTNNVKTSLLHTMHSAARERVLLLHRMLDLRDPFDRDTLFLDFNHQGAVFADARIQIQKMQLGPEEISILTEQGRLTNIAVPTQLEIADLIQRNQLALARDLLLDKAEPLQDQVLQRLEDLEALQKSAVLNSTQQAQDELEILLIRIIISLVIGVLAGGLIAVIIGKRITRTEKELQREKRLAQITLHSIGDAVITTSVNGAVEYLNPVAEAMTGHSFADVKGRPLAEVWKISIDDHTGEGVTQVLSEIAAGRISNSTSTVNLQGPNAKDYAIEYTAAPIRDETGQAHGGIVIFRDVSEVRLLASQLSYQASHDALTGLVNRREFEARLQSALDSSRAEHKTHVLCYLDLDQFKIVNDTCGHAAGDELLIQVSTALKEVLRHSDTLARLGGDEFGAILEGCSLEKARSIAEKMRDAVNSLRFSWANKQFDVGVSIGVVPVSSDSGNLADLFSAADSACYEAKDTGRNRVHIFDPDDINIQRRQGEMHLVHRINQALEQQQFVLYAQPIEALTRSADHSSFEILVRMNGDDNSLILPNAFIPAAERYNLMPLIDTYVVQQVVRSVQDLADVGQRMHFSINVSGQSLCDENFSEFLLQELASNKIDPTLITIEITETATVANFSKATRFIAAIKQLGCKVALDDFGSGLSSFTYLKNIPVDLIKIDGSFVRDIIDDATDRAFVKSINQIAAIMGIQTIAEYVETQAIAEELIRIGVNYLQGYYIGRPRPLSEVTAPLLGKNPLRLVK